MYRSEEEIEGIKDFFCNYDWGWISRDERHWWPKFCFHYTDLHNVTEILTQGFLCSRMHLESQQKKWLDVGSQQILSKTNKNTKNSVRFYFRPKTPTQYQIEGIKSKVTLEKAHYKAHCQIPVFLLFDIIDILSRQDSQFSDGNLGSPRSNICSNPKDLWDLPWQQIYHNSFYDSFTHKEITRRRCAEIINPEKIDLNGLKFIYCRSEAEKETLLNLLKIHPETYNKYQNRIISSGKYDLFFRKHTYIESVSYHRNHIIVKISPETESPGPFEIKILINSLPNNKQSEINKTIDNLSRGIIVNIPESLQSNMIEFHMYIDDYPAYQNILIAHSQDIGGVIF